MKKQLLSILPACILLAGTLTAQTTEDLTQPWLQIWPQKDGSISYYEKQYEYKGGEKVEVIYTDNQAASILHLLPDSNYTNRYLHFQYGYDCYQLRHDWNGKWYLDADTLYLGATLDFNCGYDPVPGGKTKPPGPRKIKFPFLITHYGNGRMDLECQTYVPDKNLSFMAESAFIALLQKKHAAELKKHKAVMYSTLTVDDEGILRTPKGEPFTGTTIAYYLNRYYFNNLEKKLMREYKNGLQHGQETVYFSNGEKKSEVQYKEGKANGPYQRWQQRNDKAYLYKKGEMKNGEYFGRTETYTHEGQLKEVAVYKEGGRDYTFEAYQYINGKQHPKVEGTYQDRRKHGQWKYYNKEGKLDRTENWEKGMKKQE